MKIKMMSNKVVQALILSKKLDPRYLTMLFTWDPFTKVEIEIIMKIVIVLIQFIVEFKLLYKTDKTLLFQKIIIAKY